MRRLALIGLVAASAVVVVAVGTGASGSGRGYRVDAIFDNAAALIPGEEVKVAGAKVGRVGTTGLTPDRKRAKVELIVERAGIGPFRSNAECSIRPMSLIGEKFVDCNPGSSDHPVLSADSGGRPTLGVERTHSPVDIDLMNNIMRLPYRQRLRLVLNEFGTAVAGRGDDLNEAILRSNPALQQTDRVLAILAEQNGVLRDLVANSDALIDPLAARRREVADFIVQASAVAQATAARRGDLERSIHRLPALLRELRPTMERLGALSDEMTPVLVDLHEAAPDVSRILVQLGPFSRAGRPAFRTLGDAAEVGRPALEAFEPIAGKLRTFANDALPVSSNLSKLLSDLKDTGAVEDLMDLVFNLSNALSGYDSMSHLLRARVAPGLCSEYAETQAEATSKKSSCDSHLNKGSSTSGAAAADAGAGAAAAVTGQSGGVAAHTMGTQTLDYLLGH